MLTQLIEINESTPKDVLVGKYIEYDQQLHKIMDWVHPTVFISPYKEYYPDTNEYWVIDEIGFRPQEYIHELDEYEEGLLFTEREREVPADAIRQN